MAAITKYPWVLASLAVGLLGAVVAFTSGAMAALWVVGSWSVIVALWQAIGMIRSIIRGHLGLDVLAVTAILAAVAVGDAWAAWVVVLMLTGGEALEVFAEHRAKRELSSLLERTPRFAHRPDGSEVAVAEVRIGDELVVRPGETVPVDAFLLDAEGTFDESSLTGESLPVQRSRGELLGSGTVNGTAAIQVRAAALASDSQYQQIVALVAAASDSRAPFVRLADRYAVPFTGLAFLIAGLAWWLSGDANRFAEVLVVATPCPLLIAAPVAFLGGMSRAAKHGVIVKSGGTLEQLATVRTAAFDKTGTLTYGAPVVDRLVRLSDTVPSDNRILSLAASAEALSPHVLARAVVAAAPEVLPATEVVEHPGDGVQARVDGHSVVVGKASFVAAQSRAFTPPPLEPGEMSISVSVDGEPAAQIILRDEVRQDARSTLGRLARLGVEHTVMLTGDAEPTARHIAADLGITDVRAALLPADKVSAVRALPVRPVMMVGDGVNDAPVLAAADVGVAMGARGATAASESADVVIMVDDFSKTAEAIAISQRTIRIALQSIWLGIGISVGLMLVAAFGVIPAIIGALLQEAVDLLSILNSLRAVRDRPSRAR